MTGAPPTIVPGRECGTCTLCCKLMRVPELEKPPDKWCPNCAIGKGCKIYEVRPPVCRQFLCVYLLDSTMGEYWKPSHSRIILSNSVATVLRVHVDPDRPDVWRREPYYSDLKKWSANALRASSIVALFVGDNLTVIFPDRDKYVGKLGEDQTLKLVRRPGPRGVEYDVEIVPLA
jgi:hypothetical protein